MSKELLEELNNLNNENIVYVYKDYWNEVQKKLKTLEIIKGGRIQFDFYPNDYVIHITLEDKTKVDLLKEELL